MPEHAALPRHPFGLRPRRALTMLLSLLLALTALAACARPQGPTPADSAAPEILGSEDTRTAEQWVAVALLHLRDARLFDPSQALDATEHALVLRPGYAPALVLQGLALRLSGRPDMAVASLNRAILAASNAGPGKAGPGKTDLAKTELAKTELAGAFLERGHALAALGSMERAEEDYIQALRLDPTLAEALVARGDTFFARGRSAEAEADYTKAIGLDPSLALAYINRGVARDDQGRFAEAIADYDRAIELDPRSPWAFANRGIARSQQGDLHGMCRDYDRACALGACSRQTQAREHGFCQPQ